ncbi:TolC family protein, partial [Burkholderia pseudomallei]
RARLHARTLVAALSFANAAAAFAQSAPLTLDAALQSAPDRSAAMQAAQASVQASAQLAVKAGQLPDPMLKAGIDNLPV